jgi:hypothetical protein
LSKHSLKRSSINYQQQNDLKNQLLVIKNLADNYPNSGSLNKALNNFDKDLGHKIKNKRVARCIFFITQKPKIKEQFLCSHKCISSELGLSLNFFKIFLIISSLSLLLISQIILLKIDTKTEEIDNLSCVIENKEVNSFYY